jgi:hypothetical protein
VEASLTIAERGQPSAVPALGIPRSKPDDQPGRLFRQAESSTDTLPTHPSLHPVPAKLKGLRGFAALHRTRAGWRMGAALRPIAPQPGHTLRMDGAEPESRAAGSGQVAPRSPLAHPLVWSTGDCARRHP